MKFMGYFEHDETAQYAIDYQYFLLDSPSTSHAADLVHQRPEDAGFTPQNEESPWDASPGGRVTLRSDVVVAWVVPETLTEDVGFRIVGVYTDSSAFHIKPSMFSTSPDSFKQIDVEVCGGMLWNSWLSRELAIAGRSLTRDGSQILVRTGALARIPQLVIHPDRTANPEGLKLDPQQRLHPIWPLDSDADFMEEAAEYIGVKAEDIVSHDLVLVPQQGPGTFGDRSQFSAAGQQDNLFFVHSGSTVLECLAAKGMPKEGDVLVSIAFSHEEIGSEARSDAVGPLLASTLEHTGAVLGCDFDARYRMLAQSSCVSVDAVRSAHSNYTERHDPHNRPVIGRGPIVKINANQHYAIDAEGIILWLRACEAARAASQSFVSHNAMPCDSTIGPITATGLGTLAVDVGVGLLPMHSACEISHIDDLITLSKTLEAYWPGA